jgi:hypothetical protein
MSTIINIPVVETVPEIRTILRAQGIPENIAPDLRTMRIAYDSISLYEKLAVPVGLIKTISLERFHDIYNGEGRNEEDTPLKAIYPLANYLNLFAVTIGEVVSLKINSLIKENEFALAAMLDSAASEGTELTAQKLELAYRESLKKDGLIDSSQGILRFSPGYCGWHISAQKKLFEFLRPEDIGIELRESFLMQPLKSISGVIVFGLKNIFEFNDAFPFCAECETRECRERISTVWGQ